MFMLLFRDVEVKVSVRDDPRELEKIKLMQIDKNFDNWLSAYTIYMGVLLQAYPGQGSALVKYQDLIHRAYREYLGVAWLHYDEWFRSQVTLDPSLPWDLEHQQLWSQCMGPARAIAGRMWHKDGGHQYNGWQLQMIISWWERLPRPWSCILVVTIWALGVGRQDKCLPMEHVQEGGASESELSAGVLANPRASLPARLEDIHSLRADRPSAIS
ncbi:UNVERIFIED_CONTAM: hypothetical protein K2H54_074308 [Gekko kuhli]